MSRSIHMLNIQIDTYLKKALNWLFTISSTTTNCPFCKTNLRKTDAVRLLDTLEYFGYSEVHYSGSKCLSLIHCIDELNL